jgi:hypothetical protein
MLNHPGRVRSQIINVVCQIARFDFGSNLVVARKLIIRISPGLRLNPLYRINILSMMRYSYVHPGYRSTAVVDFIYSCYNTKRIKLCPSITSSIFDFFWKIPWLTFLESRDECKSGLKTDRGWTHKKLVFFYVIFVWFWSWYCRCEIVALTRDSSRFQDPDFCL